MRKQFTIIVYNDPGHAWGKVKRRVLKQLGIEFDISAYSYQFKDNVYLEEDCDLPKLYIALDSTGHKVKFVEKTTNKQSRIRNYEPFNPFA
jgi:hypothetical protein